MTNIILKVTGADAMASVSGPLTSGMVGIPVTIEYDDAWKGLTKNLVCRCSKWSPDSGETRTILNVEETAQVAHEVMQADMYLYLGVEGYSADGKLVMPTTWAMCGKVQIGANSTEDSSLDPDLSIWNQLRTEINQIKDNAITEEQIAAVIESYLEENFTGVPDSVPDAERYAFLSGLKYYALGDSITSMQGTTASPVTFASVGYQHDLQGRDIGDITVEGYVTAIERRYGLVATNFGKGGHTLVQDYAALAAMDYSDVALVTIAYGVNDARTGVPLGTVNSTDITTFAGALNGLLKKIYTDNPECRILVLSPMQRLTVTDFGIATPNANGNYLVDFVNMCKAIAEKRSTNYLDQYRCTGINQTNLYYYTVEGVHPVNQGFARIRNAVIGILDEQFALEYEPVGVMTNTGDTEPEEPDTGGTGGGEPPEEETGATEVDLTGVFDQTGNWYDGSGSWNGSTDSMSNSKMIELIPGKTYTYETYVANRYDGDWGYMGVLAYNENFPETKGGITVQTNKSWGGTSTYEKSAATFGGVNHAKVTLTWVATEGAKWLHTIRSAFVTDSDVKLSYI